MRDFQGKVAVVTGAGGKLGLSLSKRFAREGMRIVMADIDANDLARVAPEVQALGVEVVTVQTDVSKASGVQALAAAALAAFGGVHIVCNNAGVNPQDVGIWESSEQDWQWALGVNLWAMVHAARIFVPIMLAQDAEGHIVNTASAAGLAGRVGMGSYAVSKAACVQFTEVLYHELRRANAKVSASVLCPGRMRGGGTKNRRPGEYVTDEAQTARDHELYEKALAAQAQAGGPGYMPPDDVADLVLNAIREQRFYIFTHPEATKARVRERADAIEKDAPPALASSIF